MAYRAFVKVAAPYIGMFGCTLLICSQVSKMSYASGFRDGIKFEQIKYASEMHYTKEHERRMKELETQPHWKIFF